MPRYLVGGFLLLLAVICLIILLPLAITSLFQQRQPLHITTDMAVRLYVPTTGSVQVLPLEEYIIGVVAAEMPARFDSEALKAQAVAARTFTVYRLLAAREGHPSHADADICSDSRHCQAWLSDQEMQQRWGLMGWLFRRKVAAAVAATRGLTLTYQGAIIEPVYHSTSGGRTEDASELWGHPVPYLQSVLSPWESEAPHLSDTVTLPVAEVARRLGLETKPGKTFSLRVVSLTSSGRIKTVQAGDKLLSGAEFRQLLGLNSTMVQWKLGEDGFTFQTRGYGHGVGMSQYGANGLARQGKTFDYILSYYYPGTVLQSLETSLPQ